MVGFSFLSFADQYSFLHNQREQHSTVRVERVRGKTTQTRREGKGREGQEERRGEERRGEGKRSEVNEKNNKRRVNRSEAEPFG